MYLSIPSLKNAEKNLILSVEDANTRYKLSTMDKVTITFSLKLLGPIENSRAANYISNCVLILKLTKDLKRQICYQVSDDSINLMEDNIPVFKLLKFSQFFGKWIQLSVAMNSNYIYHAITNSYILNPLLNSYWKNLYAFYVNEIPVPPFKDFNYDTNIHKSALYFNSLEIGNEFWAYLSELNVYKGYITNPFVSSTNVWLKEGLIWNYSFKTSYKNKLALSASDAISYGSFCLVDNSIDSASYLGFSSSPFTSNNFAMYLGSVCLADYNPFDSKKCQGNTYVDSSTLYKAPDFTCVSCSPACFDGCSFKGINGCSSNLLNFNKNYLKYTNYNTGAISSSSTSTSLVNTDSNFVNLNYVFPGIPETRKTILVDLSKYKNIYVGNIKVAYSQKYSMEFWYNLYLYGQSSPIKPDSGSISAPIVFTSHEFIWDNHMLIKIESIKNEIFVSCIPIFKRYSSSIPAYASIMNEFEKIKISEKQTNMYYKASKWVYVSCSTNVPDYTFSFNNKQSRLIFPNDSFSIPDSNQSINPFDFLSKIKNQEIQSTTLNIKSADNSKPNYGMLFIQDLRLWSSSNLKSLTTTCRYKIH